MPNQRAAGQKQVIVTMKEEFLSLVDENLADMGFGDRAQFIRTAVYEKLQAEGVDVEKILATPPSRAGKGGRPARVAQMQQQELAPAMAAEVHDPSPKDHPQKRVTYPKAPPKKKAKG